VHDEIVDRVAQLDVGSQKGVGKVEGCGVVVRVVLDLFGMIGCTKKLFECGEYVVLVVSKGGVRVHFSHLRSDSVFAFSTTGAHEGVIVSDQTDERKSVGGSTYVCVSVFFGSCHLCGDHERPRFCLLGQGIEVKSYRLL